MCWSSLGNDISPGKIKKGRAENPQHRFWNNKLLLPSVFSQLALSTAPGFSTRVKSTFNILFVKYAFLKSAS